MIVGATPWEKWPERSKRKLEKLALLQPCAWCGVAVGQPCKHNHGGPGSVHAPFPGNATVHGRMVCYMRILRGWFDVPDEERESMAVHAKLYAAQ